MKSTDGSQWCCDRHKIAPQSPNKINSLLSVTYFTWVRFETITHTCYRLLIVHIEYRISSLLTNSVYEMDLVVFVYRYSSGNPTSFRRRHSSIQFVSQVFLSSTNFLENAIRMWASSLSPETNKDCKWHVYCFFKKTLIIFIYSKRSRF